MNEVFFDDVKVPVENLVGQENRGWDCANSCWAMSVSARPGSAPAASASAA
ncbi:hypothetical protein ACFQU2_04785 [Siccirubricoccus deserti]